MRMLAMNKTMWHASNVFGTIFKWLGANPLKSNYIIWHNLWCGLEYLPIGAFVVSWEYVAWPSAALYLQSRDPLDSLQMTKLEWIAPRLLLLAPHDCEALQNPSSLNPRPNSASWAKATSLILAALSEVLHDSIWIPTHRHTLTICKHSCARDIEKQNKGLSQILGTRSVSSMFPLPNSGGFKTWKEQIHLKHLSFATCS